MEGIVLGVDVGAAIDQKLARSLPEA